MDRPSIAEELAADLGREAAEAAFDAGGPSPYSHAEGAGACLLPTEPVDEDWAAVAEVLGCVPDNPAARAYRDAYRARMAELVPDRGDRAAVQAAWRRRGCERLEAWHARAGLDCQVFAGSEDLAEGLGLRGRRS